MIKALEKKHGDKIKFVIVDANSEAGYELAMEYKVQFVPSMFFLNKKGATVDQHVGPIDEASLEAKMVGLLSQE